MAAKTKKSQDEPTDGGKPRKVGYVDNGWPEHISDGDHAVSEFASPLIGALSPFGDVTFPQEHIPYVHPQTRVNR